MTSTPSRCFEVEVGPIPDRQSHRGATRRGVLCPGPREHAMTQVWAQAALWLGLALIATLLSIWLRVATALSEIVVGTVAQLLIGTFIGKALLGTSEAWVTFLSGTGAIVLTFLAGAELDPVVFRAKWKESVGIGLVGFFAPFLGCAAFARWVLHWSGPSSWLA